MPRVDRRPGIRPRASLGRRLDIAARAAFPAGITVLLMLLTQAPFGLPQQAALMPALTLCCVWFWSIFRPATLPPPVVFLIGLLLDLLGYLPVGVGVFTLLAVHGIALPMRDASLYWTPSRWRFAWVWLSFVPVAAMASLLIWLGVMLLTFRLLSPAPAVFMAVLTAAMFPLVAIPFGVAHRSIADPDGA